MVCVMCMWGWGLVCCQWFLHFASCSVISLPEILTCALTSCIVMLCLVQRVWWSLVEINNLLRWLCWDEGWWM